CGRFTPSRGPSVRDVFRTSTATSGGETPTWLVSAFWPRTPANYSARGDFVERTAMNRARRLRVVLFEPSGRGGVGHSSYELAERRSRAGAEVRLITTEDYELAHLPRQFTLDTFFRRSWLTRLRQAVAEVSRRRSRPVGDSAPGRGSRVGYPPALRRL